MSLAISATRVGKVFKILDRALGLRMMARTSGEFAIAHASQFPAQSLLGDGDHELLIQPLAEIDDAPTDNAVNGRDRPAFDHSSQRLTMLVREPGRLTGRLAIKKPVRAEGVELHHPNANNLHANSADPGCFRPRRTVVDCGQSQKSPRLRPVFDRLAADRVVCALKSARSGKGDMANLPRSPS